ncbi:hypothetical protein SERLADRAFT_339519, partial [Serpula lacrymans var. lacrymans S7.9]
GTCVLTYAPLDVDAIIRSVGDDGAGATAVFIGTTRDSFKGKVVVKLEYQAYSKLAIKTMTEIIQAAQVGASAAGRSPSSHAPLPPPPPPPPSTSPSALTASASPPPPPSLLLHTILHHRLGPVPVGQPSIVIAVSSPHRREAFAACEEILEQVKMRAQIWKREYYEG